MRALLNVFLSFFIVLISLSLGHAQSRYLGISLSNNTTGYPVIAYPDLFYSNFHPGLDILYAWKINNGERDRLFVNANVGMYYHQFVQSLVRIYPMLTYERKVGSKLSLEGGLGAGLGVSFEGTNAFVLNDDGSYDNKPFFGARSQYLIGLHLGGSYPLQKNNPEGIRLSAQFRSFMQGTYVKSYVPLLPLNSFNLGIILPL